jgi:Zn-dependent protease
MNGFGNMGGEFSLGRPFGIPLTVNKLLGLVVGAVFGFALLTKQPLEGAWIVVLFASILLHEWAHALTAKAAGDTVLKVTLNLLGGVTYRAGRGGSRWDFRITAAGPLVNVVLAAGAWTALHFAGPALPFWGALVLAQTFWINAILAVFNLLPIHPMDGGRLTRIALGRRVGAGPGARIALGLSFLTLLATGLYFGATGNLNLISIVILGQLFMLNVFEMRQVGSPSVAETRAALGVWWRNRREQAAERRAEKSDEKAARAAAPDREPSPFRRDRVGASRDAEVLHDGPRALDKALDRGLAALSPDERRLLLLHRRLIEIRVDTAAGEPAPDDLALLEKHVRLGASTEVH